jgi:hypothetical protein
MKKILTKKSARQIVSAACRAKRFYNLDLALGAMADFG